MPKAIKPDAPTDELQGAQHDAPAFRRFEHPMREGVVLLWRPDSPRQYRVRFLAGFYATSDADQLACLDYLASRGQVFEVPLEQATPTRPKEKPSQPNVPAGFDKDE